MSDDDDNLFVSPDIICIQTDNEPMVTIKPDGTMEFGKDYHPDVAARAFWAAIAQFAPPAMCPKCGFIYKQGSP